MISVWIAWLLLGLPGYALARRFSKRALAGGGLGVVATSYFWTFALLSPVSLLCYLTRAPVWVLSITLVLAILGSTIDLVRERAFSTWKRSVRSFLAPEFILVAAIVAGAAILGGFLSGDARFHLARVRQFLDHGFNNFDPYVLPHEFTRAYHSNIYHPLVAALSQLSGTDYLTTWTATLPWAKLVQGGAFYALAWTALRNRRAAWISAAVALLSEFDINFSLAPNQLTGRWLVPLALAELVGLLRSMRGSNVSWRRVLGFGAALLVMVEVHALYAVFVSAIAAAVCGLHFIWSRPVRVRRGLAVILLVTLVPAPFLLASRFVGTSRSSAPLVLAPDLYERGRALAGEVRSRYEARKTEQESARGVVNVGDHFRALDPKDLVVEDYKLLGLLLLLAAQRKLRRRVWVLAAGALVALCLLYVPPLFTTMADAAGGDWAALRVGVVKKIVLLALGPAVILALLEQRTLTVVVRWRRGLVRALVSVGWLFVFSPSAFELSRYSAQLTAALKKGPKALHASQKKRAAHLSALPPGVVVLTEPTAARELVMLHDVYVISADRGSPRIPGGGDRRFYLALALSKAVPERALARVLRYYGVRYAYLKPRSSDALASLSTFTASRQRHAGGWLLELDQTKLRALE